MSTVMFAALLAGCADAGNTDTGLSDDAALHAAEQVLLRDCMRRAGFEYSVTAADPVPDAREFPYVIDDVAWARRHGYGTDIRQLQQQARDQDPNQHYFRGLAPQRQTEALKAANGDRSHEITVTTPDGATLFRDPASCRSQALNELYGNLQDWFAAQVTADWLTTARQQAVLANPAFTEATKPWAACMRASGHDYASPSQLRTSLADAPLQNDAETRLAVKEAECATSVGLADTARELDRRHGDELRLRHRQPVETYEHLRAQALPKARSIVRSDSGGNK